MTSYLSHNYRKDNSQLHTPQLGRKKIKHFSYNP